MKAITLAFSMIFLVFSAQAEVLYQSKDWLAQKDIVTPLQKIGCVAETTTEIDVNGTLEQWTLQVIKLATGNGDYTFPMIISFPNQAPTNDYYEANVFSNTMDEPFYFTLFQPVKNNTRIVANRVSDRNKVINHLKADLNMTVNFMTNEGPTRSVEYSLRGSSRTIKAMLEACQ